MLARLRICTLSRDKIGRSLRGHLAPLHKWGMHPFGICCALCSRTRVQCVLTISLVSSACGGSLKGWVRRPAPTCPMITRPWWALCCSRPSGPVRLSLAKIWEPLSPGFAVISMIVEFWVLPSCGLRRKAVDGDYGRIITAGLALRQ